MNISIFLINLLIILPMIIQADECLTLRTLTSKATKIVVSGTLSNQNKAGYFPFEFQTVDKQGLAYFNGKAEKVRFEKATDDISLLLIGDQARIRSGTNVELKLYFNKTKTKTYRVRGVNHIVDDIGQTVWKTDENLNSFFLDMLIYFEK